MRTEDLKVEIVDIKQNRVTNRGKVVMKKKHLKDFMKSASAFLDMNCKGLNPQDRMAKFDKWFEYVWKLAKEIQE